MKKQSGANSLSLAMILVGVAIIAASALLIGMQVGNITRTNAIRNSLAEKKAYEEAQAAAEHEEAIKKAQAEKEEEESASMTPTPSPVPADIVMTPEELAAASEAIKGAGTAGTATVFAFADTQRNAGITLDPGVLSDGTTAADSQGLTTSAGTAQVPATSHIVCIDPGHQSQEMTDEEPNGPGSSEMKQKVTSGTTGVSSGKEEYEVNLEVSLKLRDILESRGYEVHLTRETHDVTLSNVERAQIATAANADIFVRIHCNSDDSSEVAGVLCYGPASDNPYLTPDIIDDSQRLCDDLRDSQCEVTGQKPLNNLYQNDMTGINWATMPVSIVEMGFMSNETEDMFLAGEDGQNQIAEGLANGIDAYFAG